MVVKILKEIESQMDQINCDYGSKNEYCVYCKSKYYDSKVGIIHSSACAIMKIRGIIKALSSE